ncbi:MAG: SPOR domain-containing protein, partial [Deltaproteobacteria bacterium]|nr:SPOR domain-containing protein [Deltaproteobacteria bacterium]
VSKPDAPQETSPLTALRQEVASSQQPGPAVAQNRPDVAVSSQTVSDVPYYTLQDATMSNKQNAVKYYTELKAKGYRVYIVSKSVVPGKVFYKIRLGSFKTQVAAAAVASDLLAKEKITSIIVKSTEKIVTPAPGAVVPAAAVAKPVQPRRYVVHAGSYRNQLHSQHEVDRLLKLGFKAYSEKVDLKQKGTWYRVKVGSFADREKAGVGLKKLQAVDKKISARVVADES